MPPVQKMIVLQWKLLIFATFLIADVGSIQHLRTRAPVASRYHTFQEIEFELRTIGAQNPKKAHLYSIGKSVEGRDLWVLALANEKPAERLLLRPEVKYISTMHGDEPLGTELMLRFAQELLNLSQTCQEYDWWCVRAKILLESTRVHLLFIMNPDGYVRAAEGVCKSPHFIGRNNLYNIDLNRNFPDLFNPTRMNPIQPETAAVMRWIEQIPFSLSANFHTGSLVVNYPFDSNIAGTDTYSPTPDDSTFKFLALKYSRNHQTMHLGMGCDRRFPNGIVNGAAWYYIKGGMMDYNYGRGVMATTIELSCCKFPPASVLEKEWKNNKDAFLEYLLQINQGVRGIVVNSAGQIIPRAKLTIEGKNSVFFSTDRGEFWRILLPGTYVIKVLASGSSQTWRYAVEVPKYVPGQTVRAYKVVLP